MLPRGVFLMTFPTFNKFLKERGVQCFGCGGAKDFKLKGFNIAARSVAVLSDTVLVFVAGGGAPANFG